MKIYIGRSGKTYGPYAAVDLRRFLAEGFVGTTDWVWVEKFGWVALDTALAELEINQSTDRNELVECRNDSLNLPVAETAEAPPNPGRALLGSGGGNEEKLAADRRHPTLAKTGEDMSSRATLIVWLLLGGFVGFLVSPGPGIATGALLGLLYWWYFSRRSRSTVNRNVLARLGEHIVENQVSDLGRGLLILISMLVAVLPTLAVTYLIVFLGTALGAGEDLYFYGFLLATIVIWLPLTWRLSIIFHEKQGERAIAKLLGKQIGDRNTGASHNAADRAGG